MKNIQLTDFQRQVYQEVRKVPAGRVTTYKILARAIGCRSSQAVGQALRRNPFAPEVPCHRVIKSDLSVGGFQGELTDAALRRKMRLLKQEGVEFKGNYLKDKDLLFPLGKYSV